MQDVDPMGLPAEPEPRLVAVQEAADVLIAACNELPATQSREYALSHIDAVKIYADQAIREGGS